MYLLSYYDPATNRIEHEEFTDLETARKRADQLMEQGAATVKVIRLRMQLNFSEYIRG
jgi:hypothetical protein